MHELFVLHSDNRFFRRLSGPKLPTFYGFPWDRSHLPNLQVLIASQDRLPWLADSILVKEPVYIGLCLRRQLHSFPVRGWRLLRRMLSVEIKPDSKFHRDQRHQSDDVEYFDVLPVSVLRYRYPFPDKNSVNLPKRSPHWQFWLTRSQKRSYRQRWDQRLP